MVNSRQCFIGYSRVSKPKQKLLTSQAPPWTQTSPWYHWPASSTSNPRRPLRSPEPWRKKDVEDRRWRSERWRSPEIFPAFPRCTSCSLLLLLPSPSPVVPLPNNPGEDLPRALVSLKQFKRFNVNSSKRRARACVLCGVLTAPVRVYSAPRGCWTLIPRGLMRCIRCYGNEERESEWMRRWRKMLCSSPRDLTKRKCMRNMASRFNIQLTRIFFFFTCTY